MKTRDSRRVMCSTSIAQASGLGCLVYAEKSFARWWILSSSCPFAAWEHCRDQSEPNGGTNKFLIGFEIGTQKLINAN
jgi:hypothetical protein